MTIAPDERDIRSLLLRYAALLDAGDLDGVAALFATATWQADTSPVLRDLAAIRAAYDRVILYDGVPRTRHLITNIEIEVDTDDSGVHRTASSTSYFTVLHAPLGEAIRPVVAGTYEDTFDRERGGHGAWRFASRVIRPELQGDVSTHYR